MSQWLKKVFKIPSKMSGEKVPLGRRKGLWTAGRRFLRRQRLPDPSGIDFPSFLKVFWSLWDPFSIIFWMLILQNCPPKRDQHFHLKTKTASISPAEGRKDGRKLQKSRLCNRQGFRPTNKSIFKLASTPPYAKQIFWSWQAFRPTKKVGFEIGKRFALQKKRFWSRQAFGPTKK